MAGVGPAAALTSGWVGVVSIGVGSGVSVGVAVAVAVCVGEAVGALSPGPVGSPVPEQAEATATTKPGRPCSDLCSEMTQEPTHRSPSRDILTCSR